MGIIFRNSKNRIILLSSMLLISVLLCGCNILVDNHPPYHYKSTTWTCESPKITFYVDEQGMISEVDILEETTADPTELDFFFDNGSRVVFHNNTTGETVFSGECKFYPYKVQAHVTNDELFGGKYVGRQIVFTRTEKATFDEYLSVYAIPVISAAIIIYIVVRLIQTHKHDNHKHDNQGTVL